MNLFISKDGVARWLRNLLAERNVVAPVRAGDVTLFRAISDANQAILDFDQTTLPPKQWYMPPTERLFSVESADGQPELVPTTVETEAVIFGVRPCDAKGIALLDRPMLQEPGDALYRQRRQRTALVGIACPQAQPQCFCTSVGTAPDDSTNLDILLTETGEGYIVQVMTERGKGLLPGGLAQSKQAAPKPPAVQGIPIEEVAAGIRAIFDDPYWERLAERCVHCNICAYVCPICYCFDVRDYRDGGRIERVRSWESCQSSVFTRTAGGYDPRATKGTRLRQRFYHKLLYFPEHFGDLGCVGCGRCVRACPVNIDIREVVEDLQRLEARSGA